MGHWQTSRSHVPTAAGGEPLPNAPRVCFRGRGVARGRAERRRGEQAEQAVGTATPARRHGGRPVRVVVLGATGNVGTATIRALSADPAVTSILGLARRLPNWTVPKV